MSSIEINEINNVACGRCVIISNGMIEFMVTIDSGPRIVSFSLMSERNVLLCDQQNKGYNPLKCGHRLWFHPITIPDSYFLEDINVTYTPLSNGVRFSSTCTEKFGIELSLEIILAPGVSDAMVIHNARNVSKETIPLALCASTSVSGNGTLIANLSSEQTNPSPNRSISLWPYSNILDPRFSYSNKYLTLQHDDKNNDKFKCGINSHNGFAAYVLDDLLFTKRYIHDKDARYLDFNSSLEAYTDQEYLLIDTMSPLYKLKPNEFINHVENWSILKPESSLQGKKDEQIDKFINSIF